MSERIDMGVPDGVQQMGCACGNVTYNVFIRRDTQLYGIACSHCGGAVLVDDGWLSGARDLGVRRR